MKGYNQSYQIKEGLKKGVAYFFLVFYSLIYIGQDFLHDANHHHEEIVHSSCSEESEQDACHLALVHHKSEACPHPNHLQKSVRKCSLCSFSFQYQDRPQSISGVIQTSLVFRSSIFYKPTFLYTSIQYDICPRGPPSSASLS